MTIIHMQNVSLIRQGKTLLKNINWLLEEGQDWAILGLNGAGKTTLLKLIMAEYWKTEGQVTVLGTHFGTGNIPQLRQAIGVVSNFIAERLPAHLLAEQIVLTGQTKSTLLYKPLDKATQLEAKDLLRQLGAAQLIGRPYFSLSQGEKQLVLIARSLMDKPRLLILDEATAGLDLLAREKLLAQIARIKVLPQAPTLLYVTHHAEEITHTFSHLMLLKSGQIIAQGPTQDLMQANILSDFYDYQVQLFPIDQHRYFIKPILKEEAK